MFYFDNAASTKVLASAARAAFKVMNYFYANPSSVSEFGLKAEKIINSCRKTLADFFLKTPDEFYFTSGATESINLALMGVSKKQRFKKNIITSSTEHKATKECLLNLKQNGFNIIEIKPKNQTFNYKDFVDAVDENCFLVSLIHVNNENGLKMPIEQISKKIKEKNKDVLIHLDAAQSFLKIPINLNNVDLLSFSAHKVFGPKGVGGLYVKKGVKILPLMFGGGQEKNLRPGTQATELIAAFEVAINQQKNNLTKNYNKYLKLKDAMLFILKKNKNIFFNFNNECVPYILNISVKGIKSQIILQYLEKKGFVVSSGAACSKNYNNKTLMDLGYSKANLNSAIRISFGLENKLKDAINLAKEINLAEKSFLKYG